tara:strand:+ start:536 stop:1240 length:705 start_codon:yes stop_codon:yes gene_type:complete
MPLKTSINYSPNFNQKKRLKKEIKFIIIHYTGMKSEKGALDRLTNIQSEVSSHYFISKNGNITLLIPELYIAWHAGKSKWKRQNLLNKNSIGIEITNPGHRFGYKNFTYKQINSTIILIRYLVNKYRISKKNILGHSDIAPDRKKDPGEKFPWEYLAKKKLSIWHNIKKQELKNLRKKKCNKIEKYKFYRNLIKIGYLGKNLVKVTKAFQRRFRPEIIDGQIDQECFKISKKLI